MVRLITAIDAPKNGLAINIFHDLDKDQLGHLITLRTAVVMAQDQLHVCLGA